MRCARPAKPRTTRAMVRFGSSLSRSVTSLAAALLTALVAEPASRPAGKQQPCCTSKSPRRRPGAFQGAGSRMRSIPGTRPSKINKELPDLIDRHHERMTALEQLHDLPMQLKDA